MESANTGNQFLEVSVIKRIATVRFHRPPVNALNQQLVGELTRAAARLNRASDVWVVVLTAEGDTFCAGADLKERLQLPSLKVAAVVRRIQRMVAAWSVIPQPVIAGLQGSALGGGLELALSADIIVASEASQLGLPEVSLGIIPAAGGTHRLAQRAGSGVASKWILSGRHFTAEEALRDGVVDYVVPPDSFSDDLARIVDQVASCAPLALRQAKKAMNASYRATLRLGFKREMECYEELIDSEDRSEALRAFAARRQPTWRGK